MHCLLDACSGYAPSLCAWYPGTSTVFQFLFSADLKTYILLPFFLFSSGFGFIFFFATQSSAISFFFFSFPQMLKSIHHPISHRLTSLCFFLWSFTCTHHPLYWQLPLQVFLSNQYLNTRYFPHLILSSFLQFSYNPTVSAWKLILRHGLPGVKVIPHTCRFY